MKTFLYINHFIREKNNEEPVIAVQRGGRRVYADRVEIYDMSGYLVATVKTGPVPGAKHDVKVHVEVTEGGEVRLLP